MTVAHICEACRTSPATMLVEDDDPAEPYSLCRGCVERVRHRALRPVEWFNLAARHGWQKHLLHDDFYDQDGRADQPEVRMWQRGPAAPMLEAIAANLPRLIDFAITRWHIDDDLIAALRRHEPQAVLTAITARADTGNAAIFDVMLSIAATVLGSAAAAWVRDQYDRAERDQHLFGWCEAAAACLPADEGLMLAMAAIQRGGAAAARRNKSGLCWFRSAAVLDWIEAAAPMTNVTDDWGRLAAFSDFDLARATQWVAAGRPLNMIAIDALAEFLPHPGMAPLNRQLEPALQRCPDRNAILDVLQAARRGDPSVRIEQRADAIERRIDRLRIAP